MQGVVLDDLGNFLDGRKTALMTLAAPEDRYKRTDDSPWRSMEACDINTSVHTVNHAGKYTTTLDGLATITSLKTGSVIYLRVIEIKLVKCADLSDSDIKDLGFESYAEYDDEWGDVFSERKMWFIRVIPTALDQTPL
jgi:hypothetical protein